MTERPNKLSSAEERRAFAAQVEDWLRSVSPAPPPSCEGCWRPNPDDPLHSDGLCWICKSDEGERSSR